MNAKPRVLLCWEAGANRGHLLTLASVAKAVAGRASVHARLCRLDHASILAPFCNDIARGWPLKMQRLTLEDQAKAAQYKLTWAMWLKARGYADPEYLRAVFEWWRDTIWSLQPTVVVGDYAPTALMAARALGIPSIAVGNVYGLPPSDMEHFPTIGRHEAEKDLDQDAFSAQINETLLPSGFLPLNRLPEIYQSTMALPNGLSLCDPYTAWRSRAPLLPVNALPALNDGTGDVVFAYLPRKQVSDPTILDALTKIDLPTLLVAPLLSDSLLARLRANPMLEIRRTAIPTDVMIRRARIILCAGQGGTTALAVLSGVPYLALPSDQEKLNNAKGVSVLRSCRYIIQRERSAENILNELHQMWHDPSIATDARAAARTLRATYLEAPVDVLDHALTRFLRPLDVRGLQGW